MAWSHIVCFGSLCDCSLLKTLLCFEYFLGIFVGSVSWAVPMVALQSRICSIFVNHGLLMEHGMNCALAVSGALNMMGSCVWSIHPLFQSILGCTAANQRYPRIALCSPSCVRKNLMFVVVEPVRIAGRCKIEAGRLYSL